MNRTRPNQIKIRLSDEELQILKEKVALSGKTQQDFFISLIKNKKIINNDSLNIITEIYKELKREGNNLNQIAKALNKSKYDNQNLIDENSIYETLKGLDSVWQSLSQYLQKHR